MKSMVKCLVNCWWLVLLFLAFLAALPISSWFTAEVSDGYDGYAQRHPIPNGVTLNIPLHDEVVSVDSNDADSFLQIWNGIQGGIYEYDFYYPQLPAGTVFLRCFEVGKNDPLSKKRLEKASSVEHSSFSKFSKIVERKQFTIYEGDWEEYYAVRVEVWHRDSESHRETKLMEKFYRMEGWMR